MLAAIGAFAADARPPAVLIEAEMFASFGGWVDDSQCMDQMGSPYLLAHGLGVPVADAETVVELPAPGAYRVWVRTRDWVATWNAPGAPGRFQVCIDGTPLATVFGTEGAEWHWQDGGSAAIAGPRARVALRDLTGFEGRCDAIVLSADPGFVPPEDQAALARFRRAALAIPDEPENAGTYDLVVAGGGIAGMCAALAAARLDLRVALVQDRPVLGGNNSSEVRVWLNGARNVEPFPRVGDIVKELEHAVRAHYGPENTAEVYEDEKRLALFRGEKNIALFLMWRVNGAEVENGAIKAVTAQHARDGRRLRFAGRLFADCTGDGCVGYLAGADHEVTPRGHMGPCNLWHVADTGAPAPFPRCPWALPLADKPFPGRGKNPGELLKLGSWYWECGFDHDPIDKIEYMRDWNFRAMYGAWDAIKNTDKVFPDHAIAWAAHIAGKRESRRLLGDIILTGEDLVSGKKYPDGCVPTGWKIDLHLPDPRYEKGFEGDAFISVAHYTDYPQPYWVPYRCLYSRNIANLFMAGRDISVTHEALGAVRVMRTGGCMGEIVGMAAALAGKHSTGPRGVYAGHLQELLDLMRAGAGRKSS
ncbi:MAG TPA: hypothetical protein DCM87_15140 [Planctomycetes bacterium]|nr:hypothetical protein [Planctomycetota bacterium]